MKTSTHSRKFRPSTAVAVLAVGAVGLATGVQATSLATMEFESQALELDSGTVLDVTMAEIGEPNGADVRFAYNADRTPNVVVVPASIEGAELALVNDVAYDGVSAEDVASLSFSAEPVDIAFEPHDTVVVRTDTGAVFKIGNAVQSGFAVTFNYAQLE